MSAKGLVIFTSGFSSSAAGQAVGSDDPDHTGLGQLSGKQFVKDLQFERANFSWNQQEEITTRIMDFREENPDAPVILIGHSFGADSNMEIAEDLNEQGIVVDKMLIIDSVGLSDALVPENVKDAINIYSHTDELVHGEPVIEGATNIWLDNTSHTQIDEDPRTQTITELYLHGKDDELKDYVQTVDVNPQNNTETKLEPQIAGDAGTDKGYDS